MELSFRRRPPSSHLRSSRAESLQRNRTRSPSNPDLLEPGATPEYDSFISTVPRFRLAHPSPKRSTNFSELVATNRELVKECKRLRDMIEDPGVVEKQQNQVWKFMYRQLKTDFQLEFERKIGTMYPSEIGYREKYMRLRKELEEVKKSWETDRQLRENIETVKEELDKVRREKDELQRIVSAFICPKYISPSPEPREANKLLSDLWHFLLSSNPAGMGHTYKPQILSAVSVPSNNTVISHHSLMGGLQKFGFGISHLEAIRILASLGCNDPEESVVEGSSFRELLVRSQPYSLWEDVRDSVLVLKSRVCCNGIRKEEIVKTFAHKKRFCTKEVIAHKLTSPPFNLTNSVETFANFLLRGTNSAHSTVICDRLLTAFEPWPEFHSLESSQKHKLTHILRCNTDIRDAIEGKLQQRVAEITVNEFVTLWERYERPMTEDLLLYAICISYQDNTGSTGVSLAALQKISL